MTSPWLSSASEQARLGNFVRALELISERWPAEDSEERYHLERLALWLAERVERAQAPDALARRLSLPPGASAALKRPRRDRAPRRGVVLAALIDSAGGGAFFARVKVERSNARARESHHLGGGWQRAQRRAEEALWRISARREIEPKRFGEGLRWEIEGPAVLAGVDGESAGGAMLVAAFSLLSGRPAPQDVVVCATLSEASRLGVVGDLSSKVALVARERPAVRRVVIASSSPELDAPLLVPLQSAEELLAEVFGEEATREAPGDAINLEATLARAFSLYEKEGASRAAAILLERVLELIALRRATRRDEQLYRREELLARWRAAATRTHLGDVAAALEHVECALPLATTLWSEGAIDATSYLGFKGTCALVLRDSFRFEEAEALLEASLEEQRRLRVGKRELARTLGNLGELRTFAGHFDEAEAALEEARSYLEEVYQDEVPRLLCYLGNLELARGDVDAALAHYEEGRRRNGSVETGASVNEAFLYYGMLRALFAAQRLDETERLACEALRQIAIQSPYPAEMMRILRGRARLARGEREAGEADLEEVARRADDQPALLRFGLGLADLHRARYWLGEGGLPRREAIERACARLHGALTSLVAYPDRDALADELQATTAQLPQSAALLDATLARILERFPY